jgi:hypothetical protein
LIFKDAETLIGMKQQPALEGVVDDKIEEQHQFVAWWDANVRGADGDQKSKNHSSRTGIMISEPEAERETGMGTPHETMSSP